jgi:hypothetical protein
VELFANRQSLFTLNPIIISKYWYFSDPKSKNFDFYFSKRELYARSYVLGERFHGDCNAEAMALPNHRPPKSRNKKWPRIFGWARSKDAADGRNDGWPCGLKLSRL